MKGLVRAIAVLALTLILSACEDKTPPDVDEPSTTNATETEIYEDPNVINSNPPEAEGDPDNLEEK